MKRSKKGIILAVPLILLVVFLYTIGMHRSQAQEHTDHDHDNAIEVDQTFVDEHEGLDHVEEEGVIHLTSEAMKEAEIEVTALTARPMQSTLQLPGVVEPRPTGEGFVGSLIEGRVKEIHAEIGDLVKIGQPLCSIESPEIGEAAAEYITALAEFEYIKGDLERHEVLVAEGIGSKKEQLELEAQIKAGQTTLDAAERALYAIGFNDEDIMSLEMSYHTGGNVVLRSPIEGTVVDRKARIGMRVDPEGDLFYVVNHDRLWVRFGIPEQDISDIETGMIVTVTSRNGHEKEITGEVERVGGQLNAETRTVVAFARIDNPRERLLPGGFVTVNVAKNNGNIPSLAVPIEAIFQDEHGDYAVYIQVGNGEFALKEVTTGHRMGGWIEIVEGLAMGEQIVTRGAFAIRSEGLKGQFGHGHNH
ncbi:hypothetical protein CEE37_06850 [candidate division LCP-89 bacterium B3_LCP]|uniref:Uncharacterized protein n=1 Tax=candidate division LCP-89 bacterium B3_LCP TaxID=2012998 RepID=A0A532V0D6_UNCL8|nr:MAG: hypothetical protein CEE37_06850 [candidate division LCP-89 bacterium B3_LCP]